MRSTFGRFPPLAAWMVAAALALIAAWMAQLYFSTRLENELLNTDLTAIRLQQRVQADKTSADRLIDAQTIAYLKSALSEVSDPANLRIVFLGSPPQTAAPSATATRTEEGGRSPSPRSSPEAVAAWNRQTGRGVVVARELPALPSRHAYALWTVQPPPQQNSESPGAKSTRPTPAGRTQATLLGILSSAGRADFSLPHPPAESAKLGITVEPMPTHAPAPSRPTPPFLLLTR